MQEALSVPDMVVQRGRTAPAALAVADATFLSYGALLDRANLLAHGLRAQGVGREWLVALLLPRSADLVVAALAILSTGAAYVPLDPAWPIERIAAVLDDARPALVVTRPDQAATLPTGPWTVVALDDRVSTCSTVQAPCRPTSRPDDLAYVIYTSGSSGRPKGVELTHAGLLNLVRWHCATFAITPSDRAPLMASPAFDASVWEMWPYLAAGASLHVPSEATRADPEALRDWLIASAITVGFVATPMAERMLALPWPAATPLRTLLTGADTLHRRPPPGLPFTLVNNYGPTECTVVATSGVVAPEGLADGLPGIGLPILNTRVRVLDGAGRPVAPGEDGELYVGGLGVARGYRGMEGLTAERFVTDPLDGTARLYRTGDRVQITADGELRFLGRLDDQVKIRGQRVELDEIVAALEAHPGVRAAVTAPPGQDGERRLIAYVVAEPGLTRSALLATVRARLPDYMVPARFVRLPALPLMASGKVDRARLPDPDDAMPLADAAPLAPRSPIEVRLATLVSGLLDLPSIGVTDDLFDLGGHSLLATQLIVRLRDVFGVDLSLRTVFDHPTVAELAVEVERRVLSCLKPA
jgi:amino acid adenylation domain-containing protein